MGMHWVHALPPLITTVAGVGRPFLGNNGPATQAGLGEVTGVAFDSAGNLFVSDLSHHVVVKITPTGTASIYAGTGEIGFSGEGGPATQAKLNFPYAIAVDSSNNLYIADLDNNLIRKVTLDGKITTFAGGGQDANNTPVEGAFRTNTFLTPNGLAVDSAGNIYTSDGNHNLIRKIRTDGTVVTVAGNGTNGFSGDGGLATSASLNALNAAVAVDSAGNLFITDNLRVRKIGTNGIINTIAGTGAYGHTGDGGPAVNATLEGTSGLFVDGAGNLYVAEDASVRKINPGGIISTVAGTGGAAPLGDGGPASAAGLNPVGIQLDGSGRMYIADRGNHRVRNVDVAGIITTLAGSGATNSFGDGGPATAAGLDKPTSIAFDANDNLYIADSLGNKVRKVTSDGVITSFAGTGAAGYSGDGGPATQAALTYPKRIATDLLGNLYIADVNNNRIRKVDRNGVITNFAGNGQGGCCSLAGDGGPAVDAFLGHNEGVTADKAGNIYIANRANNAVRKVDTKGVITTIAGNGQYGYSGDGGPALNAALDPISQVSVDPAGNIYVSSDYHPGRIRKIDTNGIISTLAGRNDNGCLNPETPGVIATDLCLESTTNSVFDAKGNSFTSVAGFSQVIKISSDKKVALLAGVTFASVSATSGFGGDGGPASKGVINHSDGLAMDSKGDLYIADTDNDRIRKVTFDPPILGNISTRLAVGTGNNVLIGGFIISGTERKNVVVRALGPTLEDFGVQGAMVNPFLELHGSSGQLLASNDDWMTNTNKQEIIDLGLAPPKNAECAILTTLDPGAYTAIVKGVNDTTGVAIVETYDADKTANSKLANISTRGFVQTGSNVMIAGLIPQGNHPTKMIVRAIGPSLAAFGITNALPDPTLELHDASGAIIASNDDWRVGHEAEIASTGLPPTNDKESAIVGIFPPGNYTAIVQGKDGSTGVALVEAYAN
jgi:sugar lactone lactonase YvrE